MKRFFLFAALILMLLPSLVFAQTSYDVIISDVQTQGRTVTMKMRIVDQTTRQEVAGIEDKHITLYQDGTELRNTEVRLDSVTTDAFSTESNALPFDSNAPLIASGATVGMVVDLSQALNQGAEPGKDYVNEVRQAAELWIKQGEHVATRDPEQIGLFVPLASNTQALQPEAVKGFQYDHNLVIATVRQEPARSGATDLYDAVLTAIEQTSTKAQERGTPAYVVVFSDGTISGDSNTKAASVLDKAEAANVTLIAFGIGNPASLERDSNRLPHIAPATGGEYIYVAPDQREARIAEVYKQYIKPVDRTGYDLAFVHSAPVDNQEHTFQVRVTRNGQEWSSPVQPIPPADAGEIGTIPLSEIQQWYLLRALPLGIVVAGLATALATLSKRTPGRSVLASRVDTNKTRA